MKNVEILGVKTVIEGRWLNQFEVLYRRPNGNEGTWSFVSRNKNPDLTKPPLANAVVVVATVKTDYQGKRLLITREYRFPVGGYEYGFPAGLLEAGEDPVVCAKRELFEETGLKVFKVLKVSPPIVSSAGLSDEAVVMVFVEAEGKLSKEHLEGLEDIDSYLMDLYELNRLCERQGEYAEAIISAKAWPILYMYQQLGEIC